MKILLWKRSPVLTVSIILLTLLIKLTFPKIPNTILIWSNLIIFMFLAFFYRDPELECPTNPNLLVSPSYGTVDDINYDNQTDKTIISIFLSPLDPHIQYTPVQGKLISQIYKPGEFHPAYLLKKTKYNESNLITIESPQWGKVQVKQIAGQVARRIDTWKPLNSDLQIGEIYGMIKLGSKVILYIPGDHRSKLKLKVGDYLHGCQTTILTHPN